MFNSPVAGFDSPVEMLVACHGRIQHQCATLVKLARYLPQYGADEQARQAAANVMRYFDSAGQHHHADEEQDLFPLLLRASANDPAVTTLIDRLCRDHVEMNSAWQALRAKLVSIDRGEVAPISTIEAQQFAQLYDSHIQCEETQLLPLVAKLLHAEEIAVLGQSMSRRRGVVTGTTLHR